MTFRLTPSRVRILRARATELRRMLRAERDPGLIRQLMADLADVTEVLDAGPAAEQALGRILNPPVRLADSGQIA